MKFLLFLLLLVPVLAGAQKLTSDRHVRYLTYNTGINSSADTLKATIPINIDEAKKTIAIGKTVVCRILKINKIPATSNTGYNLLLEMNGQTLNLTAALTPKFFRVTTEHANSTETVIYFLKE